MSRKKVVLEESDDILAENFFANILQIDEFKTEELETDGSNINDHHKFSKFKNNKGIENGN